MNAELAHDAAGAAQFPNDGLPEVAILGRSNVGKSSLINALLGRRKLARTSQTPGKTRRIQFYRIEQRAYVVDLPGFGYAGVSKKEQASWRPLVESYLRGERKALRGSVLLVDVRRGLQTEERELLDWLAGERIPTGVVLTKSDKLSRARLAAELERTRSALDSPGAEVAAVSSRTGAGLALPASWIQTWTGVGLRRADGNAFSS